MKNTIRVHFPILAVLLVSAAGIAFAAEGGVSVYPAGVETILPGMMPGAGETMLLQFNNFYQTNMVVDGAGHSEVPGFHLRVAAFAVKAVHNWGVHFLGGELVSSAGVPLLYEHLNAPFGNAAKAGIGNIDVSVLDVAYEKGPWHWWYGYDVYTPGLQYNKGDLLNIGQHYWAGAPSGAVTFLPRHGKNEFSSKFQYIVNRKDSATQYRSGDEFVWEYAAMEKVAKGLMVGFNGYFDRQTTGDTLNAVPVPGGQQMRVVGMGPEFRYHMGHLAMILKYQKEFLAQNRTSGNSLWLQFGVPLGHHE